MQRFYVGEDFRQTDCDSSARYPCECCISQHSHFYWPENGNLAKNDRIDTASRLMQKGVK